MGFDEEEIGDKLQADKALFSHPVETFKLPYWVYVLNCRPNYAQSNTFLTELTHLCYFYTSFSPL